MRSKYRILRGPICAEAPSTDFRTSNSPAVGSRGCPAACSSSPPRSATSRTSRRAPRGRSPRPTSSPARTPATPASCSPTSASARRSSRSTSTTSARGCRARSPRSRDGATVAAGLRRRHAAALRSRLPAGPRRDRGRAPRRADPRPRRRSSPRSSPRGCRPPVHLRRLPAAEVGQAAHVLPRASRARPHAGRLRVAAPPASRASRTPSPSSATAPPRSARELTKLHEEMLYGRLSGIGAELGRRPSLLGEFVLVVGGPDADPEPADARASASA